jgi:hypothetical protein
VIVPVKRDREIQTNPITNHEHEFKRGDGTVQAIPDVQSVQDVIDACCLSLFQARGCALSYTAVN